jgi:phenylpropionate dioxygenase-like ring-hydroxylating dioxygenase large terminal subunit
MTSIQALQGRWYPVARSEELVARHIVHAQLLGQELALWRDDDGRANAWENRCPHRGVRLSIGTNDGTELRCRYHAWRFASGTGQCTFLPAHPTQRPASTIKVLTYSVSEKYGYLWVGFGDVPAAPAEKRLDGRHITTLRSVFVDAPAATLAAAMSSAPPDSTEVHWLQPVDEARTVLHTAVLDVGPQIERLALLRRYHARLAGIRDIAEARHRNPS